MAALVAHAQVATEAAVKAAFLYKFAAYVEWPPAANPSAPFVIATLGADDVAAELSLLSGRAIAGRSTVVRSLRNGEPFKDIQMLFIGRGAGDVRAAVLAAQQNGVLTVTESGLEHGGAINFLIADNRVSFEVSLDAAERSGHKISSRMLAVARRVLPKASS